MVWNAPKTWATNEALTAFDLNTYLRDNLLLTTPALAEKEQQYFVAAGENIVAAREFRYRYFDAVENCTSTSYTDLGTLGPQVTVETGPGGALAMWAVQFGSISAGTALVSVQITGAGASDSDAAAADERALTATATVTQCMNVVYYTDLTPGENTFTLKYRVSSGTTKFRRRRLLVLPL